LQLDSRLKVSLGARVFIKSERNSKIVVVDRTAIRAASQRRDNVRRTAFLFRRSRGTTDEDAAAARRVANAGGIVGARNRDRVDGRLNSRMAIVVEVSLVGLFGGFD